MCGQASTLIVIVKVAIHTDGDRVVIHICFGIGGLTNHFEVSSETLPSAVTCDRKCLLNALNIDSGATQSRRQTDHEGNARSAMTFHTPAFTRIGWCFVNISESLLTLKCESDVSCPTFRIATKGFCPATNIIVAETAISSDLLNARHRFPVPVDIRRRPDLCDDFDDCIEEPGVKCRIQ
jgi:hypothetical protein